MSHYQLTAIIGQGGFGTVYKARDVNDNREVALKVGRSGSVTDYEVHVMRTLQVNPGFPKIYETKLLGNKRYVAMELLGPSVYEAYRAAGRQMNGQKLTNILLKALDRLQSMHQLNFIHRDIKPHNLVFGLDSKEIYLIDFGLAKPPSYTSNFLKGNKSSKIVGSARFLSLNGHTTPDHSAGDDIESLIYTGLYLMKGSLPWDYCLTYEGEYFETIRSSKIAFYARQCPGLPAPFYDVLSYLRGLRTNAKPDYEFIKAKVLEFSGLFALRLNGQVKSDSMLLGEKSKKKPKKKHFSGFLEPDKESPKQTGNLTSANFSSYLMDSNLNSSCSRQGDQTQKVNAPKMNHEVRRRILGFVY